MLHSLDEVKKYLLSEDTCKCGLSCPFYVEKIFNFDPAAESVDWKLSDLDVLNEASVRSCCHRKHIKSTALAKDCKALPKPTKPAVKRRGMYFRFYAIQLKLIHLILDVHSSGAL